MSRRSKEKISQGRVDQTGNPKTLQCLFPLPCHFPLRRHFAFSASNSIISTGGAVLRHILPGPLRWRSLRLQRAACLALVLFPPLSLGVLGARACVRHGVVPFRWVWNAVGGHRCLQVFLRLVEPWCAEVVPHEVAWHVPVLAQFLDLPNQREVAPVLGQELLAISATMTLSCSSSRSPRE